MVSDRDISLAHPEAFDFVFGNLPSLAAADFTQHLAICDHCQSIVTEYSDIGRIIQDLPPHAEPPAGLEDRTVAAILQSLTGEPASPDQPGQSSDAEDLTATKVYRLPRRPPPAAGAPAADSAQEGTATTTPLALWRRHRGHLTSFWVAAAAVVVVLAVIVIVRPGRGGSVPVRATDVVIPLHATLAAKESGYGAASGRATGHQDASGSWDITLIVQHLKHFDPAPWYGCWYVSRDGLQVASAGTFLVRGSSSETFHMTSAVDPHDFSTMEITIQSPSKNGARAGMVILSGQKL